MWGGDSDWQCLEERAADGKGAADELWLCLRR